MHLLINGTIDVLGVTPELDLSKVMKNLLIIPLQDFGILTTSFSKAKRIHVKEHPMQLSAKPDNCTQTVIPVNL